MKLGSASSEACAMRMKMKKPRLNSDAQRFSIFGTHTNRCASRIWLKRQSFVPRGAEELAACGSTAIKMSCDAVSCAATMVLKT